jgi:hypothetical protein
METTTVPVPQQVAVTLTPALLARVRSEAESLGVPVEYIVASLVLDTLDAAAEQSCAHGSTLRAAG